MVPIDKNILLAQNIDGFLTNREGQLLYSLAKQSVPYGNTVEIGSWKGKSTVWIAQALKDSGGDRIVYAIDPHTGSLEHQKDNTKIWTFDEFQKNINNAGVSSAVRPIVKFSDQALPDIHEQVGFLFIDGGHEYEFVKQDYELFAPLVAEGGFIAFHDTPWPGVDQFITEVLPKADLQNVYFTDSLLCARKCAHAGNKEKIKTRIMLGLNKQFQNVCRSKAPKALRTFAKNLIKLARGIIYYAC